ncbi:transposase domain-containing protein [Streptomyces prasinus]
MGPDHRPRRSAHHCLTPGPMRKPATPRRAIRHSHTQQRDSAIGVLTRTFPPELVGRIVEESGKSGQRNRLVPPRVVVYFVLAMCLFSGQGYEEVARLLTQGWPEPGAGRVRGRYPPPLRSPGPWSSSERSR